MIIQIDNTKLLSLNQKLKLIEFQYCFQQHHNKILTIHSLLFKSKTIFKEHITNANI